MMNDYDIRDTGENAINSSPPNTPRAIAYGVNRLGSRHASNDTFHLDLHHSSSQPNIDPDSSNTSPTRHKNSRNNGNGNNRYKLDYYSIPVFLLELGILAALGYGAYYVHYVMEFQPRITGFFCDDQDYRTYKSPVGENFFKNFENSTLELQFFLLCLLAPLAIIVFCELVNSMFGSLKFRKIRSACACCKLHSITRRSLRITGAFILGFLLIMIATDLLMVTTGRLRPYFEALCPVVYTDFCPSTKVPNPKSLLINATEGWDDVARDLYEQSMLRVTKVGDRYWVHLEDRNLAQICRRQPSQEYDLEIENLGASWPSMPAAIFTYICLYMAYYFSYVGTARPFRMITCVIVSILVAVAALFDIELVKLHYHHWQDCAASALMAFLVTHFIVIIYLNRFKDSHYYESQKLVSSRRCIVDDNNNSQTHIQYNNANHLSHNPLADKQNGSRSNDIALKYFHIPRANYRGNQM